VRDKGRERDQGGGGDKVEAAVARPANRRSSSPPQLPTKSRTPAAAVDAYLASLAG
jgi:hypothetical protein